MKKTVLDRLVDVASSYRNAFDEVQAVLNRLDRGDLPRWAFAVDRLSIDEMNALAPELAQAELMRRRWRAALHAMVELIALEGGEGMPVVPRPEDALQSMERPSLGDEDRVRLDRFISVLDQARAGGCIYLNGTFQPVEATPVPGQRTHRPPPKHEPES